MNNQNFERSRVFTWRGGKWVAIRDNGIIYYSEEVIKEIFDENKSIVTYNINKNLDTLSIIPHESKPNDKKKPTN